MVEKMRTVESIDILPIITGLIGQTCCRKRVGRMRSLSLGFGKEIPQSNPRLIDAFYGEWEIGTYTATWRIVHDGAILCGSQDVVENLAELDQRLSQIEIGRIKMIETTSKFDVCVNFEGGLSIDFLGATSENDEIFHVFCPSNTYLEYSIAGGWKKGVSS